ncbi:MAG: glycosyltransferase [Oscillospiraceae bacterium]|nr:glycosyltransferase [Candidatus Copronaster equi]MBQ0097569.1 glycosyltransferase [Candidatus Ruminococcus equi]
MRDNQVELSISITVYNHENYLEKLFDSILCQKVNFNYEVVIGEDCSTDNSREIIRRYAQKYDFFKPIFREKNIGGTANEFDTYQHCTGKYMCIIDGDDFIIDENRLQRQYEYMESHPDAYWVGARGKIVDENNNILPYKHFDKVEVLTPESLKKFSNMPNLGCFMFKNIFLNDTDRENLSKLLFTHTIIGDWTILLYYLDKSDVEIFPDYVHCYRKVVNSTASNFNSIYRRQKNKYDVIVERMQYEQMLNEYKFDRVSVNYLRSKKAAELYAALVRDKSLSSRKYGREVYKKEFKPFMTAKERWTLPIGVIKEYYSYYKIFREHGILKKETADEIGKKV